MDLRISQFRDILEDRRKETSNFIWVSRELNTTLAYKRTVRPTPNFHKHRVLQASKIQDLVKKISKSESAPKEEIEKRIRCILDEIGYNKRLAVIRWLGLTLTKICKRVYTGIYVNETGIANIKQAMGNSPVIFLPSHRSYADFILMSYIYFTYDIEIPAIAAGMDFHGMWGMGNILRDTGAFFMRRSFNDDSLYWETFQEYISQLVVEGDLPIEFFIEGTRSRSGKSLGPKLGLLSMILKPFFTSQVPDILFVPINISYDRVLEEKLLAFELLGVPKPKESTSGLLKSLSIIKEKFGNVYIDFGQPISARNFFSQNIDRSIHNMMPIHMQSLTSQEKELTSLLAYDIVQEQQNLCVITTFNLVALSLINNFALNLPAPGVTKFIEQLVWINNILKLFGATTDLLDPKENLKQALTVHRNIIKVNADAKVVLTDSDVDFGNIDASRLKGHRLSQETMFLAMPFVTLQIYINPTLHYLVNPGILVTILKEQQHSVTKDVLFGHYSFLRSLFSYEFVINELRHAVDFEKTLVSLENLELIAKSENEYFLLNNKNLEEFLCNMMNPFIFTYYTVCKILENNSKPCSEKQIAIKTQSHLESIIIQKQDFLNLYCLNLECISNCVSKLVSISAVTKNKSNEGVTYKAQLENLIPVTRGLEKYIPLRPDFRVFTNSKL